MASTAGTVIAAGLESAGYVAQSQVLAQLAPLLKTLAVLIFVAVALQILWGVVVDGAGRGLLWKLVGPAIALTLIFATVRSRGAEWQYGEFENQRREVILKNSTIPKGGVEVSWLFDKYNQLVSFVIRNLSDTLTDNKIRDQVLFTNRQKLVDIVMNSSIVSPGLMSLINEGLQGKCGVWLSAARRISRGNRDPLFQGTPEYNSAINSYNALYSERSLVLAPMAPSYQYLQTLLPSMANYELKNMDGDVIGKGARTFVDKFCDKGSGAISDLENIDPAILNSPVSCEQVWCWSAMGLHAEAESIINYSVEATVGQNPVYKQLTPEARKLLLKEILEELGKKMSPPNDEDGYNQEDPSLIPIVISGLLLKHELARSPYTSISSPFATSSGVGASSYRASGNMSEADRRALRESSSDYETAFANRTELLSGAMTLPYFQGAILFGLSLLFPFFSLLLLIPGRMSGFFIWFGAWLWVKSWDVGWAAIMVVDEVLWDLMPHQAIYEPTTTGQHTPLTYLESAYETDPTYSLVMYYTLLSVLFFAVPSVLGQFIIRSAGEMSELLTERMQWMTGRGVTGLARASVRKPDYGEIQSIQEEYMMRGADGLPSSTWELSQRRSPVVFTNFGLETDAHLVRLPENYRIEPPKELAAGESNSGEGAPQRELPSPTTTEARVDG